MGLHMVVCEVPADPCCPRMVLAALWQGGIRKSLHGLVHSSPESKSHHRKQSRSDSCRARHKGHKEQKTCLSDAKIWGNGLTGSKGFESGERAGGGDGGWKMWEVYGVMVIILPFIRASSVCGSFSASPHLVSVRLNKCSKVAPYYFVGKEAGVSELSGLPKVTQITG